MSDKITMLVDDLLLQEIYSLREKLKILAEIVKYYEPDLNLGLFSHDLGTEDYHLYLTNNKEENKKSKETS